MKNLFIYCIIGLLASKLSAQDINVPLSNPGKPGKLKVGLVTGSIKVSSHSSKDVIVKSIPDGESGTPTKASNGMMRIPNTSMNLEVSEEDNFVKVGGANPTKKYSLEIKVPQNFSVNASTVNEGDITIENIEGEIEVSNVNGDILVNNVSGSVLANTINGDVKVSFDKASSDKSMAFSNLNGKIDISFPASFKANVKMKSDHGDIYSDFDLQADNSEPVVKTTDKNGRKRYVIDKWVSGKINGGGAQISFKTMNGDIYLRKK